METTDTPQATPATNNGTTRPPQPDPLAQLAEELGTNREQLGQVFTVIRNVFKGLGWDLVARPPNDSKVPGSEKMFWLMLSAMGARMTNSWQYDARLSDIDRLLKQIMARLGDRLAQPPPFAMERRTLIEKALAQVDQQLSELVQMDLTPMERVKLCAIIGKREQSDRRRAERFAVEATKVLQKKKGTR